MKNYSKLGDGSETFTVKAAYMVSELAKMAGISRGRMKRWLISKGVTFDRIGKHIYVPLGELKNAPSIWESILTKLSLEGLRSGRAGGTERGDEFFRD